MARPLKYTKKALLRLTPAQRDAIDAWRARQPDKPSRAEAIRLLVERALENK